MDYFDFVIGHIEDIVIESKFSNLQKFFLSKHCHKFNDIEENELEHMELFNEYTEIIEKYLTQELSERIPNFKMVEFLDQLRQDTFSHLHEINCLFRQQNSQLEGDIFDLLYTLNDFIKFKELMLQQKEVQNGKYDNLLEPLKITAFKKMQI